MYNVLKDIKISLAWEETGELNYNFSSGSL